MSIIVPVLGILVGIPSCFAIIVLIIYCAEPGAIRTLLDQVMGFASDWHKRRLEQTNLKHKVQLAQLQVKVKELEQANK